MFLVMCLGFVFVVMYVPIAVIFALTKFYK